MENYGEAAALVAIAVLVIYVVHTLYLWNRLSHIPGPPSAGFSKYWMIKEGLKARQPMAFQEATEKYGPLVRVGPNDLVTSDPDIFRRMMAIRSPYTRGPWYDAMRFDPDRDNVLSQRDETKHTKLRSQMAFGYAGKENPSMEGTIDTHIAKLVSLISSKYISTDKDYRLLDFALRTQFFTLDVISDLAFGHPFGYLDADDDVFDYIKTTASAIPVIIMLGNLPWLARAVQSRLLRGILPKATDKVGFGAFIGVTNKVVAERYHPSAPSQPDMLGAFKRHGLTEEEARGQTLLQVIAGSDTTATTIRSGLLFLITNPIAYRRLQAEIDTASARGTISSPIRDEEARKLPYLQAVIRETLRVVPPASGAFFRTVPEGGDTIAGMYVPAGTQIGNSPLAMHHSKEIYGEDAEVFRPERWVEEEDEERLARMKSTNDLVFHYGRYRCLGESVAMMEFNKVFVELLRRFDFALVNPRMPARYYNAGIWLIEDFQLRVTRREVEA